MYRYEFDLIESMVRTMGGVLFFTALAALVIQYFVAKEMAYAAREKGYPEGKYFWYCFLLGLVGMLIVLALPDRRAGQTRQSFGGYFPEQAADSRVLPRADDELPRL